MVKIVKFTIEMEIKENVHGRFGGYTHEPTYQQMIKDAEDYFYPYLADQIAGGEIRDWVTVELYEEDDK